MKRSTYARAAASMLASLLITFTSHASTTFPWALNSGDQVLLGTTDGDRSADDVIGNPFDQDVVFATQTGNTSQQGIMKFTLNRSGGQIVGATKNWTSISTLDHENAGLKSLDMYDSDTIYYTLEEGDEIETTSDDGNIGRLTNLTTTRDHTAVAGLRNVRTPQPNPSPSDYDPEGIAVDRDNNFVYVMTDDGPNTDVAQFTIDPSTGNLLQKNGTSAAVAEPTPNWVTTVEAGTTNGNDGIVLSDGRVALTAGSSSVNIYAVSQDGATVTNLLGGPTSGTGRDTPQDLLEHDGLLYLAWESGIIDAFDLSSPSTSPIASIDLDGIIGGLSIGGMGLTNDGHLLLSTRAAGGSDGEVYAFNATSAVPVPGAGIAGLAMMGLLAAKRRRRV